MNKEMTDEEFYSIQDIEELVDMCLTKDHNLKILQSQLNQANKKLEEIKEYINKNIQPEYRNGNNNEFYLELNQNKLDGLLSIIDKDSDK